MKLRFQGSTLRLRLRHSEVKRLTTLGEVREEVRFGQGMLAYVLSLDDGVSVTQAALSDSEIRVRVPRAQGLNWAAGGEIGIYSSSVVPSVVIEKDFVRTAVEEADDFDRFTNPRSGRRPPAGYYAP